MPRNTPIEEALISQARLGDRAALGTLFEDWRSHLHGLANRQLSGRLAARAGASDVVQEAFLEAHRDFHQFQGHEVHELVAWLERILERTIAKTIRRHVQVQKRAIGREQIMKAAGGDDSATRPELDAGQSTPSNQLMRAEEEKRLAEALTWLPPDQREAVPLRHLEGRPLAEIAQRLGRSPAAAAGLIKRGLQALRRHLGQSGP